MPRWLLRRLLARLDASFLDLTDPVRLELEGELVSAIVHGDDAPQSGVRLRSLLADFDEPLSR